MKRAFGDIAEGQVHYWHGGCSHGGEAAGAATPLLYLHPGPGTARHQVPLADAFAKTRRVIVPDIPGMGDSVPPPEHLGQPDLDWFADALVRFADNLGLKTFDLFGSSLGGRMCVAIALKHPDRVKHLVLNRVRVMEGENLAAMKKQHGPEVQPDQDGTYVWFVWNRMRNLYTYFPWFKYKAANMRKADLPPAELMHMSFVEHIKMCATSHKAFTAYYDYPITEKMGQLKVKTMCRPDTVAMIPGAVAWTPVYDGDLMQGTPEQLAGLAAQISAFLDS
ncbi:MAG: alpha/beta fold hydrolase [Rhodobacteraceae bacterium]|nr:alpha/beta fold hydrolase [Paracoccaceae bacterium]